MKLRILQVSDSYLPFPGGVAEHLYHLKEALKRRGHEVKVLTARYDGNEEEDVIRVGRILYTPPLSIFNRTKLTLTFSFKLHLIVKEIMRRQKFDIVHVHGPLALNLPGLALHYARAKTVATFHTSFTGFNFHKIGRIFFKKDAKKLDACIFVSKEALRTLSPYRDFIKGKSYVIGNGVDLQRFNPEVEPIGELSRKGKVILFVGRLEPRKGPHRLLRIFPELIKEEPELFLVIVGEGSMRGELERMAEPVRDRVIFTGYISRDDLPRYYRSAFLYTSPATGGETFGIVLLEAMATGIPVVASNIAGYREVIRDGVNGLLADTEDVRAYRDALLRVLRDEDLRLRLIEEGFKTARKFSWDSIAEQVESVYFDVLSRRVP